MQLMPRTGTLEMEVSPSGLESAHSMENTGVMDQVEAVKAIVLFTSLT